jgi:hypothetical protein
MQDDSRDKLMAYVRGWTDGVSVKAMRPEFTAHATLAESYSEGYSVGLDVRRILRSPGIILTDDAARED